MSTLPNIITVKPIISEINQCVDHYYFLNTQQEQGELEFWHYPHYMSTLVLFQNATLQTQFQTNFITPNSTTDYTFLFNQNTNKPKKEIVIGSHNIIGITFLPLGYNYFNLKILYQNIESIKPDLDRIFEASSPLSRVKLLDALLKNIKSDYIEPEVLTKTISLLEERKGNIDLVELESILQVSRRSILRLFKKHLGCTFRAFKNVLKFRIALKHGTIDPSDLSAIAYDSNYYDQSDFIKHFKSRANETPKKVLKSLSQVSDELIWKIL